MERKESKGMSRRTFLERLGIIGAAAGLSACGRGQAGHEAVSGGMTCRTDPKTGQQVSLLGYGCMRWPAAASPQKDGCPIDQEMVNGLIDYAIEHGVNYFDTAPIYGQGWSETVTGKALRRHPREKFLIATKMSASSDLSRDNLTAMYRRSFQRLQVDYIDYYLLHGIGGGGMDLFNRRFIDNGMLGFLLEERERGRIRHLGWSFHGDIEVFNRVLEMHGQVCWDFVQIQLNYVDWRHASAYNADWQKAMGDDTNAEYLYGELAKRDIPVVVMEPLLGGRLANVTQDVLAQMKQKRPDDSAAAWAFRFAGSFPKVLTVLSGMTYKEHLLDNLRTFSPLVPLSSEESGFLENVAERMKDSHNIPCTDCKYCMPCPYGIDIPGIFLHYNKCVNHGNVTQSHLDPHYAKARRAFLIGYDRSVPRLRQANHCIGCGQCAHKCPQGIAIPSQMRLIDDYVEKLKQGNLGPQPDNGANGKRA